MDEERMSNEAILLNLQAWMKDNGYGQEFGVGLSKLADEIVLLTQTGIGVARKVDQKLIEKLESQVRDEQGKKNEYKYAFEKLKDLIKNIVEGMHWVLRLGVMGSSFWFLGWRFAAGVASFILADELIRWGRREAEEIKV